MGAGEADGASVLTFPPDPRPPRLKPREPPLGGPLIRAVGARWSKGLTRATGAARAFESAVEGASRCDTDRCQIAE